MFRTIDDVSERVLNELAHTFDRTEKPNWRTIISVIPNNFYSQQKIEQFGMDVLQPGGSPTLSLLKDLRKRKVKLSDLINWLELLNEKGYNTDHVILLLRQEASTEISAMPPLHQSPKVITVTAHPVSNKGMLGKPIELRCDAFSDTPLHFQWFHFDTCVGTDSNVLHIGSLNKHHIGYYTCRVSNSYDYRFTRWACLEIEKSASENDSGPPLITVHPRTKGCFVGESVRLFCDAAGKPVPEFQWFHDDEEIPKATSRVYDISQAKLCDTGLYNCTASNIHGSVSSLSAIVTVSDRCKRPLDSDYFRGESFGDDQFDARLQHTVNPVSKVALLIGNQSYEHGNDLGRLVHPGNDARDIGGALRSIGFTVVCLLDLKLKDMRKAVSLFCELITKDVYAVFYFAGHGFELNGKSYLMPVDASGRFSTAENYPASDILAVMAKQNSKLNMLILDCCRSTPRSYVEDPIPRLCENLPVSQTNVVICFGCCSQGRVLESPAYSNGFLAMYICEHVGKNIKVDDVLFEVAKSIHNKRIVDPANDRTQVIYRHSTLVEDLSLCDPVLPGHMPVDHKVDKWRLLHEAPASPVAVFRNESVNVDFIFTAEFSNVLLIQSRITSSVANCVVRYLVPSAIGGSNVEVLSNLKDHDGEFATSDEVVRISNLERLRGEVTIHLEVTYDVGNERKREMAYYSLVEKPLFAKIVDMDIFN
eukprot:gene17797-19574_t